MLAGEHEVIENGAVERFGCRRQAASDPAVGIAWCGIAARVVVRQDNAGAAMMDGIGDDLAQGKVGAGFVAIVAGQMEAPGLIVDMGDPQAFAEGIAIRHAAGEEGPRGGEAVKFQRGFGTLIPHPAIGTRGGKQR